MDKEYIGSKLQVIREFADKGDYDIAHSIEDDLYFELLQAIATDLSYFESKELSELAITSKRIGFPRYYA